MPDFITHHLFGKNVLHRPGLLPQAVEAVKTFPHSFIWGLQGPDPLYYHHEKLRAGEINIAAGEMHHLYTSQLMEEFVRLILEAPLACREMLFSYFCGFLCHYACDAKLHPFVYHWQYRMEEGNPSLGRSGAHAYVESAIDSALYRQIFKKDITTFSFGSQFALSAAEKNAVGWCYSNIIRDLYQKEVSVGSVEICFEQTLTLAKIFYGGHPGIAGLVSRGESLLGRQKKGSGHFKFKNSDPGFDCLNLSKTRWENPFTGKQSYESVLQLLQGAAENAEKLIALYGGMILKNEPYFVQLPVTFCGEPIF